MSRATRELWSRTLTLGVVAAASSLVAAPRAPATSVPAPLAVAVAVALGVGLFSALAQRRPVWSLPRGGLPRFAPRGAYLAASAAAEEVVWRRLLLAFLAVRYGWPAGLALTTVGFAVAHRRRQGRFGVAVHLVTGASFGGVFVATGSVAAAITAHAAYNLLVALAVEQHAPARAAAAAEPSTAVAELRSVVRRYGATQALAGVDLTLRRGEVVALLGANGAGKTTAIAILLGLRRPDRGTAFLLGRSPRRLDVRRRVGAVPQAAGFPPTLTVREVLAFVTAHYPAPVAVPELLRRFELEEVAGRQCGGLSGGETRRLAVAAAFAGAPETVVLDEPTAGLDVHARLALWEEVRRFARDGGSVLLTTHYLDEAEALADRVVVLDHGRVVEEGPVAQVRARAGKKRVRLSHRPKEALLAGVEEVAAGAGFECVVDDPERLLRRLVEAGASLAGLEVAPLGLEEAFLQLTRPER
jgi:ABC-2 type transport system ATP-binding protein